MRTTPRLWSILVLAASLSASACGEADPPAPHTFTGRVFSDQTGMGTGPELEGARVVVSGDVDAELTTAADGTFTLSTPTTASLFVHIEAAGHVGLFQAAEVTPATRDHRYGLSPEQGVDFIFGAVGLTRDVALGIVVVDFETASVLGGESAALDLAYQHVLARDVNGNFVRGNLAPPGGNDSFITFVNVAPGVGTITPISPAGYTCTMERNLSQWRVLSNTVTTAFVDCIAQ